MVYKFSGLSCNLGRDLGVPGGMREMGGPTKRGRKAVLISALSVLAVECRVPTATATALPDQTRPDQTKTRLAATAVRVASPNLHFNFPCPRPRPRPCHVHAGTGWAEEGRSSQHARCKDRGAAAASTISSVCLHCLHCLQLSRCKRPRHDE
jgi:hypothetical protein